MILRVWWACSKDSVTIELAPRCHTQIWYSPPACAKPISSSGYNSLHFIVFEVNPDRVFFLHGSRIRSYVKKKYKRVGSAAVYKIFFFSEGFSTIFWSFSDLRLPSHSFDHNFWPRRSLEVQLRAKWPHGSTGDFTRNYTSKLLLDQKLWSKTKMAREGK